MTSNVHLKNIGKAKNTKKNPPLKKARDFEAF
jgi:hypothetical protein